MGKMGKFFLVICITVLTLIVSACGTTGGNSQETDGKVNKDNSKKTLKVLTYANWNPFEYLDNGKLVGFDIDLMNALAKEAGYKVEYQNVGWDAMFLGIQNKTSQLAISGITITDDRKQTYDFSAPYISSRQGILVPKNSPIKSGADLKGKIVAVQKGSTGQEALEKLLGKGNRNIKLISNGTQFMEVNSGGADAAVGDYTNLKSYIENNPNQNVKILVDDQAFSPEYFGIMYPKDTKLKADFDNAINKLFDNGTYASIYKKWFKTDTDSIDELKSQQ